MMILLTDHNRQFLCKPMSIKKVVSHASGYRMLTCRCMQNVIKIYHVIQE